jgi:hypothetical protein
MHCFKYQAVVTPDGLITHFYGPFERRYHDIYRSQSNYRSTRPSKKTEKYDDRESKIASAIKDLKDHPDAKLKHVADHYGLNRNTLHNRLKEKHKPAREAQPDNAALTKEEENEVVSWVENRDSLGLGPKHRELREMVVSVINNRGGGGGSVTIWATTSRPASLNAILMLPRA